MPSTRVKRDTLPALDELISRLHVAEETLNAIRTGDVDALVVHTADGDRVFTLQGAERSYRILVETMSEGAITVDRAGVVRYGNKRAARLLGRDVAELVGTSVFDRVRPEHVAVLRGLLDDGRRGDSRAEVTLLAEDGEVPVHVAASAMTDDHGEPLVCLVLTDLTAHKRAAEILAGEQFARVVLAQAAESIVVCDASGQIIRVSDAAHSLLGEHSHLAAFEDALPLKYTSVEPAEPSWSIVTAALAGRTLRGVQARLETEGGEVHLLASAAPLWGSKGETIGCVVTLTDVTSLRDSEAQLRRAVQIRDEFISAASHELRGPLNALRLQVVALERLQHDEQARQRRIEGALRQVDRFSRLIDRLLELSHIRAGRVRLDLESVNLADLVSETVERLHHEADASGCGITVRAAPMIGRWDRTRLEQVLTNLLTNAMRFAAGKPIEVTASQEGQTAVLAVRDQGAGIPAEDLQRIFQAFERGASTTDEVPQGLGLGLFIAQQIVNALGGTLEVTSTEGQGATFTVKLPLAPRD
jgi:PAS domain S-box-containing protein